MAFESNLDYESSRDPTRSKRNLTAVRSLGLSAAVNLQCEEGLWTSKVTINRVEALRNAEAREP